MENRRNSKTIKSYNSVYGEFQARDMPIRQFAAKVPYPNCLPLLIEKYVESINFIQMWLCWMNQQVISPTSYLVSLRTQRVNHRWVWMYCAIRNEFNDYLLLGKRPFDWTHVYVLSESLFMMYLKKFLVYKLEYQTHSNSMGCKKCFVKYFWNHLRIGKNDVFWFSMSCIHRSNIVILRKKASICGRASSMHMCIKLNLTTNRYNMILYRGA